MRRALRAHAPRAAQHAAKGAPPAPPRARENANKRVSDPAFLEGCIISLEQPERGA